ncbi:hypothetical protein CERSUDRAFT_116433 [Gelatoporia subvermispora B]|uniref:Uncharacterized protein n=1 Tax=Ceriporiopsis subvermispora (strain B) TaxID=914234 RepID=M2R8Z9_CERS8|nr:hypothetical protein CERSUDRAFT_116433 [Gelatoporia subvermispora B]
MAPIPGEPRTAPKPQPLGNFPLFFLFTTCTCCALFILWRRASALRTVVAHQLKTWSRGDGAIRLSMEDGPTVEEFLEDEYDEDNAGLPDDEPLALTAQRLRAGQDAAVVHPVNPEDFRVEDTPLALPPK